MSTAAHVALLRGINVGGKHLVKMEALRCSCAALGLTAVTTYLQSGNVVFRAARPSAAVIAARLEADFGFAIPVLIRSARAWRVVLANPFLATPGIDPATLHAVFLAAPPAPVALAALPPAAGRDTLRVGDGVLYLHAPGGYARTRFSPAFLDRQLGVCTTTRSWATVRALGELCGVLPHRG